MADQSARIDSNNRKTLLGVTDNASAEIRRLLVDPITGRLKVTGTIADGTSIQKVSVSKNSGAIIGSEKELNFIEGNGIFYTIADDAGNTEIDITTFAATRFQVTVGSSGAQYTTVKAAIDAGYSRILVIANTTETADINIVAATTPDVLIYIIKGVTVDMGDFAFTDTGDLTSMTIEGQGTLSYSHTVADDELFQFGNLTTLLSLKDITITNTSTAVECWIRSSDAPEYVSNVTINLPNFLGGGFDNASGSSQYENLSLVGGGTACEQALRLFSARVSDLRLSGTFIPSSSNSEAIFIQDSTINGLIVRNSTANKIELRLTNCTVTNAMNGFNSAGDLYISQAWSLTNVFANDGNIDLDGITQCSNAFLTAGSITNIPNNATYNNITITSTGSLDLSSSNNLKISGLRISSAVTVAGNRNDFASCQFLGGTTVSSGADNNGFVNCQFGADAGGGALTLTIAAGANNTRVTACMSDAAISDSGTGTALGTGSNVVY